MGDKWLRVKAAISFKIYVKLTLHSFCYGRRFSLYMVPCSVPYTHPAFLPLISGTARAIMVRKTNNGRAIHYGTALYGPKGYMGVVNMYEYFKR